ncbi:Cell division protein DamX [invertebrate metagenome]|uniref:Cell division protein DamX n=1 Tax=invertebrate metagenome TaxID=1711999 RepID=A0A2H9T729_9ZZZZ
MSSQTSFIDKQLRLYIATTLATSTVGATASALLLPPNPLAYSPTWDCRTDFNNDWLCRIKNVSPSMSSGFPPASGNAYYIPQSVSPTPQMPVTSQPAASLQVTEQAIFLEMLNASPESYVLQWQAANSRDPLEQLQQTYPVLINTTIAEYHRAGRKWFVLLDGPFASRTQAINALKDYPRHGLANVLFPWTRPVSSLHRLNMQPSITNPSVMEGYLNAYQQYPATATHSNNPLYSRKNPNYPAANSAGDYSLNQLFPPNQYEQPIGYEYPAGSIEPHDIPPANLSANGTHTDLPPGVISGFGTLPGRHDGYSTQNQHYYQDKPATSLEEFPVYIDTRHLDIPEKANSQSSGLPENKYKKWLEPSLHKNYRQSRYPHTNDQRYKAPRQTSRYNFFKATHNGYIIQWQATNNRRALERIQQRYPALGKTQIIHYQKRGKDWFALISKPYQNRTQANQFLIQSSVAQASTRLYPRIRRISGLKKLVSQSSHNYLLGKKHLSEKSNRPSKNNRTSNHQTHHVSSSKQPDNYTIQWYAANDLHIINRMKERFPELASAEVIHARRNHKNWYILVQGKYSNNREALLALKSPAFREAARQLRPWTRPLHSIKTMEKRDS